MATVRAAGTARGIGLAAKKPRRSRKSSRSFAHGAGGRGLIAGRHEALGLVQPHLPKPEPCWVSGRTGSVLVTDSASHLLVPADFPLYSHSSPIPSSTACFDRCDGHWIEATTKRGTRNAQGPERQRGRRQPMVGGPRPAFMAPENKHPAGAASVDARGRTNSASWCPLLGARFYVRGPFARRPTWARRLAEANRRGGRLAADGPESRGAVPGGAHVNNPRRSSRGFFAARFLAARFGIDCASLLGRPWPGTIVRCVRPVRPRLRAALVARAAVGMVGNGVVASWRAVSDVACVKHSVPRRLADFFFRFRGIWDVSDSDGQGSMICVLDTSVQYAEDHVPPRGAARARRRTFGRAAWNRHGGVSRGCESPPRSAQVQFRFDVRPACRSGLERPRAHDINRVSRPGMRQRQRPSARAYRRGRVSGRRPGRDVVVRVLRRRCDAVHAARAGAA